MAEIQVLNNGETLHSIRTKINDNFASIDDVHLLNTGKITNCILEQPQNIKLELNNGNLTLKAGSVVCIPDGFASDGTKKFREVTIPNDTTKTADFNHQSVVYGSKLTGSLDVNGFNLINKDVCFSGNTQPTNFGQYALWYDTTNNILKATGDSGSTWDSGLGLPLALITSNTTQIISIDKIFQSIGYIGSTVYVRKGLKVLIPNGRNSNGTLKNILSTVSSNKILTYTNNNTNISMFIGLSDISLGLNYEYNQVENKNYSNNQYVNATRIAKLDIVSGKIINFKSFLPINLSDIVENATTEEAGILRVASTTDELNCTCEDAAITPQSFYDMADYRIAGQAYAVDDTVGCAFHNNLQLKCTTAGTTASTSLDTHNIEVGQEITDGTVVWTVEELGTGGSSYRPPLLSFQWADHLLDDIQWLRADTFSWQSGDVYSAVYDKLVEEYATGTEETYGDGLVFKRTSSGFKITTAEHEQKVLNRYNTDMQCWFYILDTTNKRFKLPRTKWGFKGLRNNVGDMIPQSVILPNITGNFSAKGNSTASSGCVTTVYDGEGQDYWAGVNNNPEYKVYIDASRSSSVYSGDGTNTLIDERATQMYLYFYVGEYTQSAIEQTAGLNAELFNGKQDVCTHIISTYKSGTSGYRIWSDGYCEQWGHVGSVAQNSYTSATINFLKTFEDTVYNVQITQYDGNQQLGIDANTNTNSIHHKTTAGFVMATHSWTYGRDWIARGYLAEGQY